MTLPVPLSMLGGPPRTSRFSCAGASDDTTRFTNAVAAAAADPSKTLIVDSPVLLSQQYTGGTGVTLLFDGGYIDVLFGQVRDVQVIARGTFPSAPSITFSGGGGTGASASARMGMRKATIVAEGSNYGFRYRLAAVGGTAATTAKVEVTGRNGSGNAKQLRFTDTGIYTSLPSGTITTTNDAGETGTGSGCTFTTDWLIRDITINAGGSGYTSVPAVAASGNTGVCVLRARGNAFTWAGGVDASAGAYIFRGAGRVAFTGPVSVVFPGWFGADGTSNADVTEALQRCFDAGVDRVIELPSGTYGISSPLRLPRTGRITGRGRWDTKLQILSATTALWADDIFDLTIEKFTIYDPSSLQTTDQFGIFIDNSVNQSQKFYIRNLQFNKVWGGVANWDYEARATFSIEIGGIFENRGRGIRAYYTTNWALIDYFGDHTTQAMTASVADVYFFGNDADLGGGGSIRNTTLLVPGTDGFVIEGGGEFHCWPKFLQMWMFDVFSDNAANRCLYLKGVQQCHVLRGYWALSKNNFHTIDVEDSVDVELINCPVGGDANSASGINLLRCDGVIVHGCRVSGYTRTGAAGIGFNATTKVIVENNLVTGCTNGVYSFSTSDRYIIAANILNSNTTNLRDDASGGTKSVAGNITT